MKKLFYWREGGPCRVQWGKLTRDLGVIRSKALAREWCQFHGAEFLDNDRLPRPSCWRPGDSKC